MDKKLIEEMCDAVEAYLHQHGHNARIVGGAVTTGGIQFDLSENANVDTELLSREVGREVTTHFSGTAIKVWK